MRDAWFFCQEIYTSYYQMKMRITIELILKLFSRQIAEQAYDPWRYVLAKK